MSDDKTQISLTNDIRPGTQLNDTYEIDEKITALARAQPTEA